jgi:hypothetical protein
MSVFTRLPQDMLQWEIARFLTSAETLAFNEVLKNDERVYKKLPTDYALKHALITKRAQYEGIATRLASLLNRLDWGASPYFDWEHSRPALAEKELKKMFAFFRDPVNALIFMHLRNLKDKMARMVEAWMDDDLELYDYMGDKGHELRRLAEEARDHIVSVPFVRHVPTVDYKNVYAL